MRGPISEAITPWSVEEQGVSNKQMWPYYINMN
jgi:hypothetical protein